MTRRHEAVTLEPPAPAPQGPPLGLMTIGDFAEQFGMSISKVYKLLGAGKLKAKKSEGQTLITRESILDWYRSLPDAQFRERR